MSTIQEELTRDLLANLIQQYYDVPVGRRANCHWVMNAEWMDECRKIAPPPPMAPGSYVELIMGRPIHVAADGGFPHLVPD